GGEGQDRGRGATAFGSERGELAEIAELVGVVRDPTPKTEQERRGEEPGRYAVRLLGAVGTDHDRLGEPLLLVRRDLPVIEPGVRDPFDASLRIARPGESLGEVEEARL